MEDVSRDTVEKRNNPLESVSLSYLIRSLNAFMDGWIFIRQIHTRTRMRAYTVLYRIQRIPGASFDQLE